MIPPLFGKQEVGTWRVKKRFPRYGVPIWSVWPNIRFLPSIAAEKNATKNEHICSMCIKINKGNAKRGISPRLKIRPCDLDLWPWKSIGFQTLLSTMYVPSLVKIHWMMLILECSHGCYTVKNLPSDLDRWPMTLKINRVSDSPKD